jgi:hypothetical protein
MRYLLILIVLAVPCAAQTTPERESLKGLSAIPVSVQVTKGTGLPEEMVQQFVELKLRTAGIKVPADNTARIEDGAAHLSIVVVSTQEGILSAVSVNVTQMVRLIRKPSTVIWATTWDARQWGGGDKSNEANIKESLGILLDSFINDYLAVNQK